MSNISSILPRYGYVFEYLFSVPKSSTEGTKIVIKTGIFSISIQALVRSLTQPFVETIQKVPCSWELLCTFTLRLGHMGVGKAFWRTISQWQTCHY